MKPKLETLVERAVRNNNPAEMALGHLRYEALRRLTPSQFTELHRRNIRNGERFDDIVDVLVVKYSKP